MDSNDRSVVGIVMVAHALVHTYELTIPILMVIWLIEFSTTEAILGIMVAIGYGLFGLGALPSGIVADRYGSQRLIGICLLGMGLSFVVLSFASNLAMIALAICLWGAAASIYHPAGLSLISTAVKDRGTGFAYHGMAGNIGIALGPLAAVILLWITEWRFVTFALAIPAFLAVGFIVHAEIDEMAAVNATSDGSGRPSDADRPLLNFLKTSKLLFASGFLFVFFIIIFNGLYYRGILTFLPELLADFVEFELQTLNELDETGEMEWSDLIYVGLLMVGISGQYVGGRATDRISIEKGLLAGYVILATIALLFVPAALSGVAPLVLVSFFLGFFLFMLQPIYQVAVSEYSPPESRGISYGYTYVAQFGVGALGAAFVGVVLTYSTVSAAFVMLAAMAAIAVAFSGYLFWRSRSLV